MSRDIVVEALWRVTAWGVGEPGEPAAAAASTLLTGPGPSRAAVLIARLSPL